MESIKQINKFIIWLYIL